MSESTPPQVPYMLRVLTVGMALAGALVLGECTLRAYALTQGEVARRLGAADPYDVNYELYGRGGYRPLPLRVDKFYNGAQATYNEQGIRGPLVAVPKPPDVYRVLLLGGSTAAGWGVGDSLTIDAYMRRDLDRLEPNKRVEVVSLAVPGYDSYQDLERLRVDGVLLQPDVVILHTGINDVRNARFDSLRGSPDPRTLIWQSTLASLESRKHGLAGLWLGAKHYSFLARLPGIVREGVARRQELDTIRTVIPHESAVNYFDRNVSEAVKVARSVGASVVLSVPPSAIAWRNRPGDPVERSYWVGDAGTTEAYRRKLATRLEAVARRLSTPSCPVWFLASSVPRAGFLDDAHLTAAGNRAVAQALVTLLVAGPLAPILPTRGN